MSPAAGAAAASEASSAPIAASSVTNTLPTDTTSPPSTGPSCRRIQVSREKRPLNFFVTLSKKFLTTDDVIELSGLGLAVTTVVTIAEILRNQGLVFLKHIQTSLVEPHPDGHTAAPKAKIQIWIHKTPEFDSIMASAPPQTHARSSRPRPHHDAKSPEAQLTSATSADAGNTDAASPDPVVDSDAHFDQIPSSNPTDAVKVEAS